MTRVLIDGFALSDGSQLRGIGTHLKRVITGLCEQQGLSVSVLAEQGVQLPSDAHAIDLRQRAPRRLRALEHEFRLPGRLRSSATDVYFSPAQHPPRKSPVPWIQTLHDLIPLTHPHPMLARDRALWMRIGPRLRGAAAVVAVSRFSAEEGIRHLRLDPRRVHVVPPGVDTNVFHPHGARPNRSPYLLHLGAWGPHKGFAEAIAVAARVADHGFPHRLVLAGPQDPWMVDQIRGAVARSARPDCVDVVGYVDDLPATYRGATALLMTSRCEGFGLPALEAMACGTPVVAFANSSLPEVVGDAGVLVPDGDTKAMATAVRELIHSAHARRELKERGMRRAAGFRWERTVAKYAALLRAAVR